MHRHEPPLTYRALSVIAVVSALVATAILLSGCELLVLL